MTKHPIKFVKTTIYIPEKYLEALNFMSRHIGSSNSRIISDLLNTEFESFHLRDGKKLTDVKDIPLNIYD